MYVKIEWTELAQSRHPLWVDSFCLYAYLHPDRDWLLYVGKADYCTVRERMRGDHKRQLYDDCWDRYGIEEFRVLHGSLLPEEGCRRSSALLSDVESLLIKRLKPFGNIQSRVHRISRPGMRVVCTGAWPLRRDTFRDSN